MRCGRGQHGLLSCSPPANASTVRRSSRVAQPSPSFEQKCQGPRAEYTLEDFNALIAVNLAGFFHMTGRAIEHMLENGRGHVVNVSTALVETADSERPSALSVLTKGGLTAATRSLAIEYASRGLRVNAVSLGDQDAGPR
jgi:NAD(P)-dependent dehydrogenase (short-subunit alcohol dehydrogenase family)